MTKPRKPSSTNIYHVVTRGVNKRDIFGDAGDRMRFLDILSAASEKHGAAIYAWCLMTNHVHLLLSVDFEELPKLMNRVDHGYARYFNEKDGRVGHLYQGRFRSEPVETEAYLLTVTRYIHQNPVKAFMTGDCDYRWSSYGEYLGGNGPKLCDTSTVLGAFGGLSGFLQFHSTVAFDDKCLEIKLKMSDDEAREYCSKVIGAMKLENLRHLDRHERDSCLRTLKCCMVPCDQLARITGASRSAVYRA